MIPKKSVLVFFDLLDPNISALILILTLQIAKIFALLCLTQIALAAPNSYIGNSRPYSGFQMRPEDESAVQQIGPQGIQTGTQALNVAGQLVKDVFPRSGPIVRNGQVQTKWGSFALPNPQDSDLVERMLQAARDLIERMPIVE